VSQHFDISFRVARKSSLATHGGGVSIRRRTNIPLGAGVAKKPDHCPVECVVKRFLIIENMIEELLQARRHMVARIASLDESADLN
jgi:hypothetical protein